MKLFKNIKSILQLVIPLLVLFALILGFIYVSDANKQKEIQENYTAQRDDTNTKIPPEYQGIKIGLALGGGGAKGFAHIGVIKVLQENHIPIQIVTGTSAGSVVGALFSYGFNAEGIQQILKDVGYTLMDFGLSSNGFIEGNKLRELVNKNIDNLPIESLTKKFGAVATDFSSGDVVMFTKGDVGQAVRASSSIPAIFKPTEIDGRLYVDGGLTAPVPVSQARSMGADVVIAVDISDKSVEETETFYQPNSWFSTIDQSVVILMNTQLKKELEQADVVIRPNLTSIPFFNFFVMDPTVKAGEEAARAALPEIKQAIKKAKEQKQK
ncbi:patatin-like phospholipase family protein [Neisseriaceae bacterium PsAf]|nr:patatin-like phospholipase family protein [Neisseriaceae bacterium PsAf]MCV2502522.1 patatin-like phospholipase family protein [Neisseriaceae bacterium]